MTEWVSTKERLPQGFQYVVLAVDTYKGFAQPLNGVYYMPSGDGNDGRFFSHDRDPMPAKYVDFWFAIPEIPTEKCNGSV